MCYLMRTAHDLKVHSQQRSLRGAVRSQPTPLSPSRRELAGPPTALRHISHEAARTQHSPKDRITGEKAPLPPITFGMAMGASGARCASSVMSLVMASAVAMLTLPNSVSSMKAHDSGPRAKLERVIVTVLLHSINLPARGDTQNSLQQHKKCVARACAHRFRLPQPEVLARSTSETGTTPSCL